MNGFAGLLVPKNRRLEETISSGRLQNLWKESAALVAGQVALIAKNIHLPTGM